MQYFVFWVSLNTVVFVDDLYCIWWLLFNYAFCLKDAQNGYGFEKVDSVYGSTFPMVGLLGISTFLYCPHNQCINTLCLFFRETCKVGWPSQNWIHCKWAASCFGEVGALKFMSVTICCVIGHQRVLGNGSKRTIYLSGEPATLPLSKFKYIM